MKNYYFNEEHELFRQGLRDFLNKEVVPNIERWEEEQRIPKEIFKKFVGRLTSEIKNIIPKIPNYG